MTSPSGSVMLGRAGLSARVGRQDWPTRPPATRKGTEARAASISASYGTPDRAA